ncbi:signal transduction histidine kinase [Peptoniphilus olsenii]|uniref:histidine kinase n=1 Tax=Peptoniphilus olsenii TaxID=411570 RepID=A0ABV2J6J1_9FIRM
MDKKYNLRNLIISLLLIAVISVFVGFYLQDKANINNTRIENHFHYFITKTISSSLEDDVYEDDSLFNYAVKSYKKKYYDSFGDEVRDQDLIDTQKKIDKLKEKGLNPNNYIDEYEYNNELNSEYKTFYLTNDDIGEQFDPETLSLVEKDFGIRGIVNNDKVIIKETIVSERLNKSDYKNLPREFKKLIKTELSGINNRYNIGNLKFVYYGNLDDPVFENIKTEKFNITLETVMILSILCNLILSTVFALFIKTKGVDSSRKLKSIFTLPIEFVGILFLIFTFTSSNIISWQLFNNIPELFLLLTVLGNIIIALTIFYLIINFKTMFIKDVENYVVNYSLIGRGIKKSFDVYNDSFNKDLNEDQFLKLKRDFSIKYLIVTLILLFIIMFIVNSPELTLLLIILSVLFYYISIKLMNEISRINFESNKIVMGNYKNKIEKKGNMFDRIIDNFNNISSNLDEAVEDAIKSERMKTELITNVSHDLKTPLTSIINFSDLINNSDSSLEDKKEYAKIINEKSLKLKVLIEDLFDVSKASSNNIELSKQKLDFKSLVEQSIGEWEDKINEKNIKLVSNLPEEKVILELDGQKFSRVLDNLFSNISKYALENSRVYINLYNDENVRLIIKNISKYELGISEDELIERFTRGEKSRTTAGSGLGLSIASSFVKAHGADFKIEVDGDLFKTIIEF